MFALLVLIYVVHNIFAARVLALVTEFQVKLRARFLIKFNDIVQEFLGLEYTFVRDQPIKQNNLLKDTEAIHENKRYNEVTVQYVNKVLYLQDPPTTIKYAEISTSQLNKLAELFREHYLKEASGYYTLMQRALDLDQTEDPMAKNTISTN